MDVDLNDIDDKLKQIKPNETDFLQQALIDAKSAEDDIAIAKAINEIEEELNDEDVHRSSLFDPEQALSVDVDEIDANLEEMTPVKGDFENQGKKDLTSAEDDLAIAEAINEVEDELKKAEPIFNTTTVMMMVVAGGIIASKLLEGYFKR